MTESDVGAAWFERLSRAYDQVQSAFGCYHSAEFRAVLQQHASEDRWTLVLGKLQFSEREPPLPEPAFEFLVDPRVHGLTIWLPAEDALRLAEDFGRGAHRIKVGHKELPVFLTNPPLQPPAPYNPDNQPAGRYNNQFDREHGVVAFPLPTREEANRLGVLQEDLAPMGLHAVPQLLYRHVIDPTGPVPTNTHTRPESGLVVVLPFLYARLAGAVIDGNSLDVHVGLGKNVSPEGFSIVIKASLYSNSNEWGDGREFPIIEKIRSPRVRREFPGNIQSAYVELFWDRATLPYLRRVDSATAELVPKSVNVPLKMYERFDPDFSILRLKLRGDKRGDDQVAFEWAVAQLMTLAGFHVQWPGYLRGAMREKEIDIIAIDVTNRWMLLGECTIKGADVDRKLVDLADKALPVTRQFDDWMVKKVLFTTITAQALKGKQDTAANDKGIILVPQESLAALAERVQAGHPREGIWHGFRRDLVDYPRFTRR